MLKDANFFYDHIMIISTLNTIVMITLIAFGYKNLSSTFFKYFNESINSNIQIIHLLSVDYIIFLNSFQRRI